MARRFPDVLDEHRRVIAHLPSGGVVATLVRERARVKGLRRGDVLVCGALVRNVSWAPYVAPAGAIFCEGRHA